MSEPLRLSSWKQAARRRPIADQARDLYINARRKQRAAEAVATVAKRLGLSITEVRALLGLPPKEENHEG